MRSHFVTSFMEVIVIIVQIRSYFEGLNELNIKIDKLESKSNEIFDLISRLLDKNRNENKENR